MFYCYVLRSRKTERRYIGSCEDLNERIRRHNAGDSKATKHAVPWVLVQSEGFAIRAEASRRERYYKTGRGRHPDRLVRVGDYLQPAQARSIQRSTGRVLDFIIIGALLLVIAINFNGRTIWIADAHRDDSSTIFLRNDPHRYSHQSLIQL